ncbi:guanylate kinase [Bacillus phage PBC2]|uniref:Putative guanylate kinase n=1 Tax=Bacillus phage PBC2 TaxID=1675029 RepID=A0A218KC48_9CAUD|nr:guanylate kinase [Bacillus phage PBC2]AKQ08458.1 putative guanylate kinase [Bacillus phage PBC2]
MTLFLITAPSGAGKTSIMHALNTYMGEGVLSECVSHTTRPMREGEVDGESYYFTDEQTFKDGIVLEAFAETVKYDGHLYGISKSEIDYKDTRHAYIIVNYDGYKQVKKVYPDAVGIFLYMSKEDCMISMLERGDSIEKALSRIELYDDEIKDKHDFDYVVKNVRGKFHETKNIVAHIIGQYGV